MTRTHVDYTRLTAELEATIGDLVTVSDQNSRAANRIAQGADDQLDLAALGFTIHNVYGIVEMYALRVARFFENGLDEPMWPRDLVRRMTLAIDGMRPALLDESTYLLVDELRSFRHLFRNLYARPLDPVRLAWVQERIAPAVDGFLACHREFDQKMKEIAAEMEAEG